MEPGGLEEQKGERGREKDLEDDVSLATAVERPLMYSGTTPSLIDIARNCEDLNTTGCAIAWVVVNAPGLARFLHYERFLNPVSEISDVGLRAGRKRSALPLREGALKRVIDILRTSSFEEACAEKRVASLKRDCWMLVGAVACNFMFGAGAKLLDGAWNKAERTCMHAIGEEVDRLLCHGQHRMTFDESREKKLRGVRMNYQGEEMGTCHKLSLRQVLPALPPADHGGIIDCLDYLGPHSRFLLENPKESLLPDVGQELPKLQARIHIDEGEKLEIARELVQRGVCGWLPLSEVAEYRGQKVLNGLFGVEKPTRLPSGECVLRLIMNLIPSNSVLRQLTGSVDNLPSITSWMSCILEEDEVLKVWQSDMCNAFYLFRLPKAWMPFLSFGLMVQGETIGKSSGVTYCLSCKVLPMGWGSSVAVMQEISERILLAGRLPGELQLTRKKALPTWMVGIIEESVRKQKSWWHVYLDNFCAGEIGRQDEEFRGGNDLHELAEKAWAEAQVMSSDKKRQSCVAEAVELGALLDGEVKTIGGSPERFLQLIQSTLYVLSQGLLSKKSVQVLAGRWIHVMQYRRPCMCILNQIWEFISKSSSGLRKTDEVRMELFMCICLIPFMRTYLGAKVCPVLTASDASMKGGAVGIAKELTEVGNDYVQSMIAHQRSDQKVPILVISLFNGIGGALRIYDILGLKPEGMVSFDTHGPANRIVSRRWPHCEIHWDVKDFDENFAKQLLSRYINITEIHLWWGFPCTDLSSAKADRQGLAGQASGLFFEGLRIKKILLKLCGNRIKFKETVENVASMDKDQCEVITSELGVVPYFMDCVDQVPMHRPRLCWCTERFDNILEGIELTPEKRWIRVSAPVNYPPMEDWIEPGMEWPGGGAGYCLPTCMKAIVRNRPPLQPAGIRRCTEAALQRYQSDSFRYPPYQYSDEFIFYSSRGTWRLVSAQEKELLMGYGWDHTSLCMSASAIKSSNQRYWDERHSLLGDSFSIFSFVIAGAAMCRQFIPFSSYQQLASRMGMAPGFRAAPQLSASIQRKLQFGFQDGMHKFDISTLNKLLLSRVNHTGSDVKITTGEVLNPRAFPRQSFEADLCDWHISFKVKWERAQHINILELRSILLAVKYHISHLKGVSSRLFHITDSYICMSIISKGRSGSKALRNILRQLNATLLSHGLSLVLGHVESTQNPTDGASRQLEAQWKEVP